MSTTLLDTESYSLNVFKKLIKISFNSYWYPSYLFKKMSFDLQNMAIVENIFTNVDILYLRHTVSGFVFIACIHYTINQ